MRITAPPFPAAHPHHRRRTGAGPRGRRAGPGSRPDRRAPPPRALASTSSRRRPRCSSSARSTCSARLTRPRAATSRTSRPAPSGWSGPRRSSTRRASTSSASRRWSNRSTRSSWPCGAPASGSTPGPSSTNPRCPNSIAWRKANWSLVSATTVKIPYFDGKMLRKPLVLLRNVQTGQLAYFFNTHNPANARGPAQEVARRGRPDPDRAGEQAAHRVAFHPRALHRRHERPREVLLPHHRRHRAARRQRWHATSTGSAPRPAHEDRLDPGHPRGDVHQLRGPRRRLRQQDHRPPGDPGDRQHPPARDAEGGRHPGARARRRGPELAHPAPGERPRGRPTSTG